MEADKNNNQSEISKFLDQFEKDSSALERVFLETKINQPDGASSKKSPAQHSQPPQDKDGSFKKLEAKIHELEQKFDASLQEKKNLEQELAKSKEIAATGKTREEFFNNIANTIASLKESVDRLAASRPPASPRIYFQSEEYGPGYYYGAPIPHHAPGQLDYNPPKPGVNPHKMVMEQRELLERKDVQLFTQHEEIVQKTNEIEVQRHEIAEIKAEKEEQNKVISGLKEKTSRLKAVNFALEKEFKRAQEEKIEALRISAVQAKEILSLREQLNKAEEKFKTFDFEGRIISIKKQYEQKVVKLENQLQEISALCMKQVEEIESLKTENINLKRAEEKHIGLQLQYEEKLTELAALTERLASAEQAAEQARADAAESEGRAASAENRAVSAESKVSASQIPAAELTALKQQLAKISAERDALAAKLADFSRHNAAMEEQKQTFEAALGDLKKKMEGNNAVIESLKKKIDVLNKENQDLKAAPKHTLPVAPPAPKAGAQNAAPARGQQQQPAQDLQPQASAPAAPQNTAYEEMRIARSSSQAASSRASAKRNGEEADFMADTQTFIGRLKWSLLKDD